MCFCQDYDKDFFIDRPKALAKICDWANAADDRRVLSVVAPPGWGKTWILEKFKEEWGADHFVIAWMHAPTLINRNELIDTNHMIDVEAFLNFFDTMQNTARQRCPHIEAIDPTQDVSDMIRAFADFICECNLEKTPLVIVDGYDEITDKQAETFSLRLLAKLIEKRCIRLVIAHRVDWSVKGDSLRRTQRVLLFEEVDTVSRDFAHRQFDVIYRKRNPDAPIPDPEAWMGQLKEYRWDHPLANCFLFQRGLEGSPSQLRALASQDYYECCRAIIERPDKNGKPRDEALNPDEFKTLHRIAGELGREWTQDEIQELLDISNFYVNETTRKFFNRGLISESSPPYYHVIGGLFELLREMDIDQI